jgi:ATP-dependent exoDNAse (exonuclease V) beta subunit
VVLPDIPSDPVPQAQHFDVAKGDHWLSQTPPKWARTMIPELCVAEERWNQQQQHEAFCLLYVALTRAKRGLYVLLEPPSKSSNPDKPSLANWLARSIGDSDTEGVLHQSGDDDWTSLIPLSKPAEKSPTTIHLTSSTPRRGRDRPSAAKSSATAIHHSPTGLQFGTEVHDLLEKITWTDASLPDLPHNDVGQAVARVLRNPALDGIFKQQGRPIELFREQGADVVLDGKMITGVIDRLHLQRDTEHKVTRVEIIDFKTDAVQQTAELVARYSGQMEAYRQTLQKLYPEAEVLCTLLSVKHGELVSV